MEAAVEPIRVWAFDDAPPHLRSLSTHGGDEDWLAEVPPPLTPDSWVAWMESGSPFGCCDVFAYAHPTRPGWHVRIGAHA